MNSFLKIDLPFHNSLKFNFLMALFYSSFVVLFLYTFKPFKLDLFFEFNKLFTVGYGIISTIYMFSVFSLAEFFYNGKKWNVFKVILQFIFIVITISLILQQYHFLGKSLMYYKSKTYLEFLYMITAIGIMPTILLVFYLKLEDEKSVGLNKDSSDILPNVIKEKNSKDFIIIKSSLLKEVPIIIKSDEMLYIKSDNNYCHFYYLNTNNEINNKMMRVTLKHVEKQLDTHRVFIRCHNSYIVNTGKIIKVSGNSTNRKINLCCDIQPIPVSRSIDINTLKN